MSDNDDHTMLTDRIMPLTEDLFDNRAVAAAAAADRVAHALGRDLVNQTEVSLVVSGGATPKGCFALLADTDLEWEKVHILMSDERCVAPRHAASNEAMIRRTLLKNRAASAELVPIFNEKLSPLEQCRALAGVIDTLPLPFSLSLLGMGEDGHFASLFPDIERLEAGLDLDNEQRCLPVQTAASPHLRITLTMSTLLRSREVLLLFFGDVKRDIYEQAKSPDSSYPIARLLQQNRTPVHAIWAP